MSQPAYVEYSYIARDGRHLSVEVPTDTWRDVAIVRSILRDRPDVTAAIVYAVIDGVCQTWREWDGFTLHSRPAPLSAAQVLS